MDPRTARTEMRRRLGEARRGGERHGATTEPRALPVYPDSPAPDPAPLAAEILFAAQELWRLADSLNADRDIASDRDPLRAEYILADTAFVLREPQ